MEITVYKVVTATMVDDQESWFSSLAGILGDYNVRYRPGYIAKPPIPGSYLYAFRTQEQATEYARGANGICLPTLQPQVWEATAEIVNVAQPTQAFMDFERFWRLHYHALEMLLDDCKPTVEGTVWCRWLTIEEMVWGRSPEFPKRPAKKKVAAFA